MLKRVLLAAEFLRGGATPARLLPLAGALTARGHDVTLALPAGLTAPGFETRESPRWSIAPPPGFVAVSYADILMHGGYATPDALRDLMTGWRDLLANARPDLLVADFSPTAMLAARLAGIPMAAVGDGFSLPPPVSPMPAIRPWAGVPADAAAAVEGRVLAVINARLSALGIRELRDLFRGVPAFLCTFPELDHYLGRPDGVRFGEVFPTLPGTQPAWPDGPGERILIALDPRHPALPRLAEAGDRLGLPCLIDGTGLPVGLANQIEQRKIRLATDADPAGCDIVVCQSASVAAPALLAGKPVLMLPVFVEQMMTLHRVAAQGLGHGVSPDADVACLDAALRRLVDDRACRLRAVNFARIYNGYHPTDAVEAVADGIEELLAA
jgi:hypothetical protein